MLREREANEGLIFKAVVEGAYRSVSRCPVLLPLPPLLTSHQRKPCQEEEEVAVTLDVELTLGKWGVYHYDRS